MYSRNSLKKNNKLRKMSKYNKIKIIKGGKPILDNGNQCVLTFRDYKLGNKVLFHKSLPFIVISHNSNTLSLLRTDPNTNEVSFIYEININNHRITCIAFHPTDVFLIVGTENGFLQLCNISDHHSRFHNILQIENAHDGQIVNDINFDPSGRILVSVGSNNKVNLWNVIYDIHHNPRLQLLNKFHQHTGPITNIIFHPSMPIFATLSDDNTVKFWNINYNYGDKNTNVEYRYSLPYSGRKVLAFHPNKPFVVIGFAENLQFYEILSNVPNILLYENFKTIDMVYSLAFHPTKPYIVTSNGNNILHFWNISTYFTKIPGRFHPYIVSLNARQIASIVCQGELQQYRQAMATSEIDGMTVFLCDYHDLNEFLDDVVEIRDNFVSRSMLYALDNIKWHLDISTFTASQIADIVCDGESADCYNAMSNSNITGEVILSHDPNQMVVLLNSIEYFRDNAVIHRKMSNNLLNMNYALNERPRLIETLHTSTTHIDSIDFHPDKPLIIIGGDTTMLLQCEILDTYSGQAVIPQEILDPIQVSPIGPAQEQLPLPELSVLYPTINTFAPVFDMLFSTYTNELIIGAGSNMNTSDTCLFFVKTDNEIIYNQTSPRVSNFISCIAIHPIIPFIVVIYDDMYLVVIRFINEQWQLIKTYNILHELNITRITSMTFHATRSTLVVGCDNNSVICWNFGLDLEQSIPDFNNRDGFMSGSWDNFCLKRLSVLNGHTSSVSCVAFSPSTLCLATSSWDNTIRLWETVQGIPGTCNSVLNGHTGAVNSLAFHPNGQILASVSDDKTIRIWRIDNEGKETSILRIIENSHTLGILCVRFDPLGQFMATGSFDKSAILWNITDDGLSVNQRSIINVHTRPVTSLVFYPTRRALAIGSMDNTVIIWDF